MTDIRIRLWLDGEEVNLTPHARNALALFAMDANDKARRKRARRALKKKLSAEPPA